MRTYRSRKGRGGINTFKSVMSDSVKATDLPNAFKEVIEATTEIRRYPALAQWAEGHTFPSGTRW